MLRAGSAWWRSQRLPVGAGQSAVSGLGSQQCRRVTVGGGRTPRALAARVGRVLGSCGDDQNLVAYGEEISRVKPSHIILGSISDPK